MHYSLTVGVVQAAATTQVGLHHLLVSGQCFALELILSSESPGL